jgi:Abnormal spindle-like microcephaly-assoc'd, ASPM-SPD-2-Hydin
MDLVVQAIYRTQGQPDFWFDPPVTLPLSVAAGAQAALDVTTTAAPSPGYVNTNEFEVASNDPFTPGARVLCRCATAGPRIEVQPDFVEFQRPPVVPAQATITIYNHGSSQLDVDYVQVTSPPFNLVGVPASPFSVPAAGQQQFQVEFAPTKTGIFTAFVQVRSNDALRPTVGVGLHGHW